MSDAKPRRRRSPAGRVPPEPQIAPRTMGITAVNGAFIWDVGFDGKLSTTGHTDSFDAALLAVLAVIETRRKAA